MRLSTRARRWATTAFVAVALGFLAAVIVRNADQLGSFRWELRPGILVVSVLAHSAVLLWGVRVWQILLRRFGFRVAYAPLARAWLVSNLGRYIPGAIWQFIGLAHLGASAGLPPVVAVSSLAVHLGFSLVTAVLIAILLVPPSVAGDLAPFVAMLRWTTPAALLVVHPAPIRAALGLLSRISRRPVVEWQGEWRDGVLLLALSLFSWAIYGGAFFLFLAALIRIGPEHLALATGANALAFVAGYAAVISPGGLGVKEGALALLLGSIVPVAVAATLAIAARLWSIASELLPLLLFVRARHRGADEPRTVE